MMSHAREVASLANSPDGEAVCYSSMDYTLQARTLR